MDKPATNIILEIIAASGFWFLFWFMSSFASLFHPNDYNVAAHATLALFALILARVIYAILSSVTKSKNVDQGAE